MKSIEKQVLKKILSEFRRIDPAFCADLLMNFYCNPGWFEEDVLPVWGREPGESDLEVLARASEELLEGSSRGLFFLKKVLSRVKRYVEEHGFHMLMPGRLKREFMRDVLPGTVPGSVTPEVMIAYKIGVQREFASPELSFLLKEYRKGAEKAEAKAQAFSSQLAGVFKARTLFEAEIELVLRDEFAPAEDQEAQERFYEEAAKRYGGTYDAKTKTVVLPRGIVAFLASRVDELQEEWALLEHAWGVFKGLVRGCQKLVESARSAHEEAMRLSRRVEELQSAVDSLRHENAELLEQLKRSKPEAALVEELVRLRKELQAAQRRATHLESLLAELEEEKKAAAEVKEDLEIPEPERRPIRPYRVVKIEPYSRIVISGGRYSSQDETEIEEMLASLGCDVHFVPAEQTIRKQDLIRRADIVFFDTSRHAHSFFEKVKSLNPNVVLVRGKSELKGMITESTRAGDHPEG
ncbi:MAG: hypothetical protein QXI60_05665 [Thermofilaceae archaeon]